MYVSCIQFYVVSGNDVCRIGKAWESLVLLFAIPEVFFGIFLEGSLIDSRIGRVAAWYPHYLFLKAQATSACDMLFNFSSASIPIKHLILLFFVWKRTQLWWLFCWISLLIFPDLLICLCGQAALHGFFHPAGPELHYFDTGWWWLLWISMADFHMGEHDEHGEGQELDDVICG